ncbi:MAG: hypothetical protein HYX69_21925 [Planctomycetia bacterium]|nr:hypothetical protein [Planctomycetia bacterium]
MSTGTKILLGLGIGCGGLVLLCCGSVVGVTWLGYSAFQRGIDRDPAKVKAAAAEIGAIDLPADLLPKAALDLRMPFTGQNIMTGAVYTGEGDREVLGLAEFAGPFGSPDQHALRSHINEALNQPGGRDRDDDFEVQKKHNLELEIRNEPAKFQIEEGVTRGGEKMIRAAGQFQGKHGTALLFLQLDAEKHPVEQVEELIKSIH